MHVLAAQINQPMSVYRGMFSVFFKPNHMFCSCFELFILVGLQQTMGLTSLMPIFAGSASFYNSCMF